MDQSNIAGIGNIYTDEILYLAKIYPKAKINEIEDKLDLIYDNMKIILNKAIENDASIDLYPNYYLAKARKENSECRICGGLIKRTKVNGRSTYFCKKHQK